MAHVIRHKISDKILSIVSSASQESQVKVSGALARLGFQTATDEEARAFARSDALDYDYRHGMMMDEVKASGERDGMMEDACHYQRHAKGFSAERKNGDWSEEQAAQDKPQISAWDAGWNVTNAIQVQLQLHTLLISSSNSHHPSSAHIIYSTQLK